MGGADIGMNPLQFSVALPDVGQDLLLHRGHGEVSIQSHAKIFEGRDLFNDVGGWGRKSGRESPSIWCSLWLWGVLGLWVEHDNLCFVGVNFHSTFLTPGLASIDHALELVRVGADQAEVVNKAQSPYPHRSGLSCRNSVGELAFKIME